MVISIAGQRGWPDRGVRPLKPATCRSAFRPPRPRRPDSDRLEKAQWAPTPPCQRPPPRHTPNPRIRCAPSRHPPRGVRARDPVKCGTSPARPPTEPRCSPRMPLTSFIVPDVAVAVMTPNPPNRTSPHWGSHPPRSGTAIPGTRTRHPAADQRRGSPPPATGRRVNRATTPATRTTNPQQAITHNPGPTVVAVRSPLLTNGPPR